jgi:hypothetical protein
VAKLEFAISRTPVALIDEKTGKVLDPADLTCEIFQPEGIVYFVFRNGMVFLTHLIVMKAISLQGDAWEEFTLPK